MQTAYSWTPYSDSTSTYSTRSHIIRRPHHKPGRTAGSKGKGEGVSVETKSLANVCSKLAKEHSLQENDVLTTETIHFLSLMDIEGRHMK
jgi:hypothetical protein